jgi:hypothetical protein
MITAKAMKQKTLGKQVEEAGLSKEVGKINTFLVNYMGSADYLIVTDIPGGLDNYLLREYYSAWDYTTDYNKEGSTLKLIWAPCRSACTLRWGD